jgi:hypothetical protein
MSGLQAALPREHYLAGPAWDREPALTDPTAPGAPDPSRWLV